MNTYEEILTKIAITNAIAGVHNAIDKARRCESPYPEDELTLNLNKAKSALIAAAVVIDPMFGREI